MSIAEVYQFPAQQEPSKEVRVADCDNGYLRIANELLDEILKVDLSKHQLKVLMAIVRKTYGFNKKSDRFTNAQISEMTGVPETRVCTAKNFLLDANIIKRFGREIGVNKNLNEWCLSITQNREELPETGKNYNIPQNGETFPETGCKTFPETGNGGSPKQGNTKDTYIKDNIKDNKILKDNTRTAEKSSVKKTHRSTAKQTITDLDFSSWPAMPAEQVMDDWLAHRKSKKATITQTVINNFGAQFQIAAKHGLSVDECLSECITRNWQGFKAEWLIKNNNQRKPGNQPNIPRQTGFSHTGEPSFYAGKI